MQRIFVLGLVAAALTFGAVLASATPPGGIAGGPILARGTAAETLVIGTPSVVTVTKTVKIRVRGKVYTRRVKVQVDTVQRLMTCGAQAACDTAVQQVTINPGGHTGWHTHPGPTFVAIAQGEGTLYHGGETDCTGHKFAANAGFFQPSADVHNFRNEGTAPLVLYALYVLPSGTPSTAIRTDQPAPANCPNIP
jgi:quercetin dioxygenase-like cupin family protein